MNRLTIATQNLERGEAVELLPELTAQAGAIDLLLMQEGGNWHRDGHRARYRAEELLAAAGLGRSVMNGDLDRGPLHTLVFWNPGRLLLTAHHDAMWPWVPPRRAGVAEFELPSGLLLRARSVHWPAEDGAPRLEEAKRSAWMADPACLAVVAGDMNSLWPDCAGHQEYEPDWSRLPPHKRGDKTLAPGLRDGGELVSDRRACAALAEAGFASAGCLAAVMTPTVNRKADQGEGGRIDHIAVNGPLAACYIPGSYAVWKSDAGNRASDHRLVSAAYDLEQCPLLPAA